MAKDKQRYMILTVPMDVDYMIPLYGDEDGPDSDLRTLNGWTVDELVEDWFGGKTDLNSYHASRDNSRIGNGVKLNGEIRRTKI